MLIKYVLLTILLAISFETSLLGQNDSVYLDKYDYTCDRGKAKDLLIFIKEGAGNYRIIRQDKDSNNIVAIAHGTHSGVPFFVGPFVGYYKNGQKKAEGNYENNKRVGEWNYYYEDGNLWYVMDYGDHELFTYYKDGKIKRHENIGRHRKIKGTCYNERGRKIKYIPFLTIPTPGYNLSLYLYDNTRTRKKRKHDLQSKELHSKHVLVRFSLDSLGNVDDVRLLKSLRSDLDSEVVRLVSMTAKWEPFKIDGTPQPINGLFDINADLLTNIDRLSIFSTNIKYCRYSVSLDNELCVTCSKWEFDN